MTTIRKIEVPTNTGQKNPQGQLAALAEAVNMLGGVTDQDQRAVRQFEFQQAMDAFEQRLKAAGL